MKEVEGFQVIQELQTCSKCFLLQPWPGQVCLVQVGLGNSWDSPWYQIQVQTSSSSYFGHIFLESKRWTEDKAFWQADGSKKLDHVGKGGCGLWLWPLKTSLKPANQYFKLIPLHLHWEERKWGKIRTGPLTSFMTWSQRPFVVLEVVDHSAELFMASSEGDFNV